MSTLPWSGRPEVRNRCRSASDSWPGAGHGGSGVLVPVGHPLAAQVSVDVEALADYEMLNPSSAWTGAFREVETPTVTPAGRPIRYTADDIATMTGRAELTTEDLLTLVARGRGLHCTVTALLDQFPFPGLTVVPIQDLPPMAVVPIWRTAAENATIRAFVETARDFLTSDGNQQMSHLTAHVANPIRGRRVPGPRCRGPTLQTGPVCAPRASPKAVLPNSGRRASTIRWAAMWRSIRWQRCAAVSMKASTCA